jgi:hypothetical protein
LSWFPAISFSRSFFLLLTWREIARKIVQRQGRCTNCFAGMRFARSTFGLHSVAVDSDCHGGF